jgi:tripartite-type tricarboxylate transporter receptor subunit TctC
MKSFASENPRYPNRPLKLIIPYAPGGGLDLFNRPLVKEISNSISQPIVIENKEGASGIVGATYVAKSKPDGHTFLTAFASQFLQSFFLKNLPFSSVYDFEPIAYLANAPICIAVNSELPVQNLKDLIDHASRNKNLAYATSGNNTIQHLTGILLEKEAGITLTHIPYKSAAPAIASLLSNEVSIGILVLGPLIKHLNSGKLRVLAFLGSKRSKIYPNIPTLHELGLNNLMMPDNWIGYFFPKNADYGKIEYLNRIINNSLKNKYLTDNLELLGYEIVGGSIRNFKDTISETIQIYNNLTKLAGVIPQ